MSLFLLFLVQKPYTNSGKYIPIFILVVKEFLIILTLNFHIGIISTLSSNVQNLFNLRIEPLHLSKNSFALLQLLTTILLSIFKYLT